MKGCQCNAFQPDRAWLTARLTGLAVSASLESLTLAVALLESLPGRDISPAALMAAQRAREDGTETPLPSYEEALAEIVRVSRSEAACVREALEQVGVARVERDEARAESARVPGLEQANREAHQAIAALKAKAARVNEAWARFYVASENVFVMAIGSVGEGRDLAPERAKREAAREALRALVADVDVLLKEADR